MMKHLFAAAILATATMGPVPARAGVPEGGAAEAPWGTISYQRTGGFAGIRQTLVVDGNGLARGGSAGTTRTFRLTPAELGSLRRGLDRIRTWSSSTAGCDVPDHFTYTLEYHGRRAVRCHEPPADWRPAIARLDEVIARHVTAPATSGD